MHSECLWIKFCEGMTLYVEVKTVHPHTGDTEQNWRKVERRREHLTPRNEYIVDKQWMGATIFGNSFSARASFLAYSLETEAKLVQTCAIAPGRCVLVFCGTGFPWHPSELENFADFYRTGRHRADDPFARMELHHMAEHQIELSGNIEAFAAMIRKHDQINPGEWVYPVRGPHLAGIRLIGWRLGSKLANGPDHELLSSLLVRFVARRDNCVIGRPWERISP